ncbi:hypothetical protein [Pantoea sp. BAV 3049]|uniref:hypothetical protein n=1 Tax=Pantoea sp. BAV 3049 TaxID=2654188 RepID=UPI00131D8561|nr:hypothetical protein [Pantoea sp. BAV 3049]
MSVVDPGKGHDCSSGGMHGLLGAHSALGVWLMVDSPGKTDKNRGHEKKNRFERWLITEEQRRFIEYLLPEKKIKLPEAEE